MKSRTKTLAGLLLFALGCGRQGAGEPPAATTSFAPEALLAVDARELPESVRARYRLQPDRRLLSAAAEVERILADSSSPTADARWRDGHWSISFDGTEIGELSPLPDFEESTELLVRRAKAAGAGGLRDAAASPTVATTATFVAWRQSLELPDPPRILAGLAAFGEANPAAGIETETLRTMVSSLAWLTTLTTDRLEQSDALFAEAWAWLAVERAVGVRGNEASEALVARALGYEAAAERLAAALPEEDPIRLFVRGQRSKLHDVCAQSPTNVPAHLLLLALDAEREDAQRFYAALRDFPAAEMEVLPLLGFEVKVRDYDRSVISGRELAESAFRAARQCSLPGATAAPTDLLRIASSTREFEAAVTKCADRFRTGPLGSAAVAAYFRSAYYSGLFGAAQYVCNHLASGRAASDLADEFGEPAASTASDLRRWLVANGAVLAGDSAVRPLAELIESSHSLGSSLLLALARSIDEHAASTDPFRRRPIPALFAQLDSRPTHRVVAARIARSNLNSPRLFETFVRAAAEVAPHSSAELPALSAQMDQDIGRLRAISDDAAMPAYAQTVALSALAESGGADDALVRARYEATARDPDGGIAPLLDFLEKRGDLAGASAAVAAALDREKKPGSLRWAYLRSEAARLRVLSGDAKGAWKLVEPAIATGKEDALLMGAEVRLALSDFARALDLARACLKRYPESAEAAALIARARWGLDDPAIAAKELAASRTQIVGPWNRLLPEAFTAAFAGEPAERAQRAFAEMIAAQVPTDVLADAAIALGRKQGVDVAIRLLESLPKPAPEWAVKIALDTYDLIAEKSGEPEAKAWYASKHRATVQEALVLYQFRRYELLLAQFPSHEKPTGPGVLRVLQLAALLHLKESSGPRWQALADEVAQDSGSTDFFARAARYFVGTGDADSLWHPEPHLDNVASVGWAIGVKMASERRFVDAEGWFQVALESGQEQEPPHAWAWKIESDWLMKRRTLELLQKEGGF